MSFSRRAFVGALAAAGFAGTSRLAAADGNCSKNCSNDQAVYVVATIMVKSGKRDEFVKIFKDNVPNVLAEEGCIFYDPLVDIDSGIGAQGTLRSDVMVVAEKWASLNHLKVHLDAPHMAAYRENVKDLVVSMELQILSQA